MFSKRTQDTPLVHLKNIRREFAPSTVALAHASFTIYEGDSVAISGASGSGKSTLLAILGLLQAPTGGEYLLRGQNVTKLGAAARTRVRREHIGFVFQAFHLVQHLSLTQNIVETLVFRKVPLDVARQRAAAALGQVGLSHRANFRPAKLSGGEQQRAAIARALACEPEILLCDEPTGNLDSRNADSVLNLLERASDQWSALVIVTHEPKVAARCSRQLIVRDGVVEERL